MAYNARATSLVLYFLFLTLFQNIKAQNFKPPVQLLLVSADGYRTSRDHPSKSCEIISTSSNKGERETC